MVKRGDSHGFSLDRSQNTSPNFWRVCTEAPPKTPRFLTIPFVTMVNLPAKIITAEGQGIQFADKFALVYACVRRLLAVQLRCRDKWFDLLHRGLDEQFPAGLAGV